MGILFIIQQLYSRVPSQQHAPLLEKILDVKVAAKTLLLFSLLSLLLLSPSMSYNQQHVKVT